MNARARALAVIPPAHPQISDDMFNSLLNSNHPAMVLAVIRTFQLFPREALLVDLRTLIANASLSDQIRSEALVALSAGALLEKSTEASKLLMIKTIEDPKPDLRAEAVRALRVFRKDKSVQTVLRKLQAEAPKGLANLAALSLGKSMPVLKWEDVAEGGNSESGRRVFYHPYSVSCSQCHSVNHQGGNIGPDLSVVARAMDRKKLVQSILHPSAEIAPQFTVWTFVLENGKIINGVILGEANKDNLSVGTVDGKIVSVKRSEIDEQVPQKTSLMPDKMSEKLTQQELRDLVAYLETLK